MKQFIGIALVLSSFLFYSLASGEETPEASSVQGVGEIRSSNLAAARAAAIDNALKESVLRKVKELLGEEAYLKNEDLLGFLLKTEARALVKNFRILKERRLEDSVVVQVVVKAEDERIRDQLEDWGILYERGRRPHFGLGNLDAGEKGLSSKFIQRLIGLGYSVGKVDGSGKQTEKAYDLTFMGSLDLGSKKALVMDINVHLSENQGRSRSVRTKVARPRFVKSGTDVESLQAGIAAVRFLEVALPIWLSKVGQGNVYRLDFQGLSSYQNYQDLLQFFRKKSEGFSGVQEKRYARGRVLLEVFFDGSSKSLIEKVQRQSFGSLSFELSGRSGREILFAAK